MRRWAALTATVLAGCTTTALPEAVELAVVGPPVAAAETGQGYIYRRPDIPDGYEGGGIMAQHWSMLGREDRAATADPAEYAVQRCPDSAGTAVGPAALDAIADRARDTRVVIVNESHVVTRHRDTTRRLLTRLRPLGYSHFAAETFSNRTDEQDPVERHARLPYAHFESGYYSKEPVFGSLVEEAKRSRYTLKAYEEVSTEQGRSDDMATRIARREHAQAENLAAILEAMEPDEKLFVHVGYAHADERETGKNVWMAARLKQLTGIDPLTIGQTICRGGGDTFRLLPMPRDGSAPFDYALDHPVDGFRHGRAAWRFEKAQAVPIPEPFASADEPLVIEAFRDGEPFDAVPEDRVYVEPGEDVRLALPPGRYSVRAVRLAD